VSRTVKILRAALNQAVKLRLLPYNPCAALDKPKVGRKEVTPLEPEQCAKLFAACESHRLGDLIVPAAMTGLRKGELFALHWNAVNLDEGVLVVRSALEELSGGLKVKDPKTSAGRRVVALDAQAIKALRSRLKKAKKEGFEPEDVPIVFANERGGYLRGSNFDRRVWYPIRKAAGIPATFVFHDLRHTQASLMLAAGVDLKVIQKRLGHRDFATTANTYSHLLQNAQNEAVEKLSAMMKKATAKEDDET
jgi:integrase